MSATKSTKGLPAPDAYDGNDWCCDFCDEAAGAAGLEYVEASASDPETGYVDDGVWLCADCRRKHGLEDRNG